MLGIPMDRVDRKRWQANRDILGPFRGAVADPLARLRDDRLAGFYDGHASFVFHHHFAGEHQCKFLKLRPLTGLGPSRGTPHMRDARVRIAGIGAADILVEKFSLWNRNAGRSFDQSWHYSYRSASTGTIRVALRAG